MPRSGLRVSTSRVPPLPLGSSSALRGFGGGAASPRVASSIRSGAAGGRHREEASRLEGRRLREHVVRAGRVVLDVGLWVKQVCNTPSEEDLSATWNPDRDSEGSMGPDDDPPVAPRERLFEERTSGTPPVSPRLPGMSSTYKVPYGVREGVKQPRTPRSIAAASVTASARPRNAAAPATGGKVFIGIEVSTDRYSGIDGLKVVRVAGGSPAADGGLRPGDYLRRMNGVPIHTRADLKEALHTALQRDAARVPSLHVDVFRPASSIVQLCILPIVRGGGGVPEAEPSQRRSLAAGSCSATPRGVASKYVYIPAARAASSQRSSVRRFNTRRPMSP